MDSDLISKHQCLGCADRSGIRLQAAFPTISLQICSLLTFLLLVPSLLANDAFTVNKDSLIVDKAGRVRIFHGMNVVFKTPPFVPPRSPFDPSNSMAVEDLLLLQKFGFNVVRLGVMWPAVEPKRREYNQDYLAQLEQLVNDLGNYGISTLLDFHQDILHPLYCGEGLPDFALRVTNTQCNGSLVAKVAERMGGCKSFADYKIPTDPNTGYPATKECLKHAFAFMYVTPEISSAFQHLYSDPDLVQAVAEFWAAVAARFATNENVLGYDLLNEPWAGDVWSDLHRVVPGYADRAYLQPLYEEIHQAVRRVDDSSILFYEPTQFPDALPAFNGQERDEMAGFTETPGGVNYANRSAMSFHMYCCEATNDACLATGSPVDTPAQDAICDSYDKRKIEQRVLDARNFHTGNFLTEFGACDESPSCIREINRVAENSDKHFSSWAYWQFKYFNDITTLGGMAEGVFNKDGTLQIEKLRALSRTYAQAIAGSPISTIFNTTNGHFFLSYRSSVACTDHTVIYFNAPLYYPNGFSVLLSDGVIFKQRSENQLELVHSATLQDNSTVIVAISQKVE